MVLRVVSAVLIVALSTIIPPWAALYIAMGSSVLATTSAAVVGVFWLFPSWFPAAINQGFKWFRVEGRVSAARASVAWPGLLSVDVESLTLTNPAGYEHKNLLHVANLGITFSIWSVFTWCVKMTRLEAEEATIWLERKEGLGVNAVRYYNYVTLGSAEDADIEKDARKHKAILPLLGALPSGLIKSVSDKMDGASGLLQMTGQSMQESASELAASVKGAGGITLWAEVRERTPGLTCPQPPAGLSTWS